LKVSIIIPWIRPHLIKAVKRLAINNAGIPKKDIELLAVEDKERIGHTRMINDLVERSAHDLVCFIADDTFPQKNYLKNALECMNSFSGAWGLVALNDGTERTYPPFHWLIHKKCLEYLDGKVFYEGYWHCCSDKELGDRMFEIDRYKFCRLAFVIHNHPDLKWMNNGIARVRRVLSLKGREPAEKRDDDYKRIYSREWLRHDQQLYKRRAMNKWKATDTQTSPDTP